MPCGIPDQQWPGGYGNIDSTNGLRYDTTTGKMWAKPPDTHWVQESAGTFTTNGSAVFMYGSTLRIAWSPLFNARGGAGQWQEVAKSGVISHTNTTHSEVALRPRIGVPGHHWMIGWPMVRPWLLVRLAVNTGGGWSYPWSDQWSVHPFRFTQGSYSGGDINNQLLTAEPFSDNIPSGYDPGNLLYEAYSGEFSGQKSTVRYPAHSIDVGAIAPEATTLRQPKGATWQFQAQMYAITPDACLFNIGPLPILPYLWSFTDLMRPVDLTVSADQWAES